jgi:hypothetical protein
MLRSLLKVFLSFLLELFGKNLTYEKLESQLHKSHVALTNWSTKNTQNPDNILREYLYKERKSLLKLKIWLLEQDQKVTARTYVTATDLHGNELKAACLEHHVEAFELLKMMREHMPIIPTRKSFTGVFVLSGKAFLALQFNQFVFSSDRV